MPRSWQTPLTFPRLCSVSEQAHGPTARKQALADLLSRLEWAADTDVKGSSTEEIAAAQQEVARNMGW
jgi:hypothetical protein